MRGEGKRQRDEEQRVGRVGKDGRDERRKMRGRGRGVYSHLLSEAGLPVRELERGIDDLAERLLVGCLLREGRCIGPG